jgi:hypothetical protein
MHMLPIFDSLQEEVKHFLIFAGIVMGLIFLQEEMY